jgi:hypothetical protein
MKEFHAMVKKGMTAAQIAKKIGMKEKDVAEFMKGMKESTDLEEKKDSPKEFEKKVVHTVSIMKKYPANKNKSDAVLRKGAIKYLTQKPRGASDDWNESLDLARLKLLLGR